MLRKLTAGVAASAALVGIGAGSALAAHHPNGKPAMSASHDRSSADRHSRDVRAAHIDTRHDR